MRIYSLIVLLVLPLALRSCQPQNLLTVGDLVRGREVVTDSSKVVQKNGGYQGILIIGDYPDTEHGQSMKKIITGFANLRSPDISIPEKNLIFFEDFAHVIRDNNNIIIDNEGLWMLTSGEYEVKSCF